MADPFSILGITTESDDSTIRRRYLELVREYPPESSPEEFARIRSAYESLKDTATRLRFRLFEAGKNEDLQQMMEEVQCKSQRPRITLASLVKAHRKP